MDPDTESWPDSTVSLVYGGWEPHSVVWWTNFLTASGVASPLVRVVGREPVTSTAVFLDGQVVESRHRLYDRGFTLRSGAGADYKVGGTNTTSSIAALMTVLTIPAGLLGDPIVSWRDLFDRMESAIGADLVSSKNVLLAGEVWLRRKRIARSLKQTLDAYMPQAGSLLDLVDTDHLRSIEIEASEVDRMLARVERLISRFPQVTDEGVRLVSLIGDRVCLEWIIAGCAHSSVERSRACALALRSFEFEFQSARVSSPATARAWISDAAAALTLTRDAETRVYLAEDIGYMGPENPLALDGLKRALLSDDCMDVRWSAAVSLGRASSNTAEVLGVLSRVVKENDTHPRVVKAALVSIGRLLHRAKLDLTGAGLVSVDIRELVDQVSTRLTDRDATVKAYAVFALGECPSLPSRSLEKVAEFLSPDEPYVLVAHSVLALYKAAAVAERHWPLRGHVIVAVSELISMPFDQGHPGSSYHEWFLASAWKLLSRLEAAETAARFAKAASVLLSADSSRSRYFAALADLQLAEHLLSVSGGNTSTALAAFSRSEEAFRSVSHRSPFVQGSLSDVSAISAITRATWVSARKRFVVSIDHLEACAFGNSDSQLDGGSGVEEVRTALDTIIESRPQFDREEVSLLPSSSLRSAGTEATLAWFRDATFLLDELFRLQRQLAEDEALSALTRTRSRVRSTLTRLRMRAPFTQSVSIERAQVALDQAEAQWFARDVEEVDLYEFCANGLTESLACLRAALPVPDIEHQLVGRGRARFAVYDAAASVHRFENAVVDEWTVVDGETVTFRVVVAVDIVSDDEVLLLLWTVRGQETVESGRYAIGVHEGLDTSVISLSSLDSDEVELEISLNLISAGYVETIERRKILVRWLVPESDLSSDPGHDLERLLSERSSLIRDLSVYRDRGGQSAAEVRDRENELANIESVISGILASVDEPGSGYVVSLTRPPIHQRNGWLICIASEDEQKLEILRRATDTQRTMPLPATVVVERGSETEILVPEVTYQTLARFIV